MSNSIFIFLTISSVRISIMCVSIYVFVAISDRIPLNILREREGIRAELIRLIDKKGF